MDAAGEALSANEGDKPAPQDVRANRFKVAVYREVRRLFEVGRQNEIKQIVDNDARKTIGFDRNPFNWALQALSQSGEFDDDLTSNKINILGWQLLHAFRHHIEPEMLIGFLYQTAASSPRKLSLIKRSGAPYLEPWLAEYERRIRASLPARLKPGVN